MYFQTSETLLEIEFMKCELMVQSLGKKKENYSKSVVEASILLKKAQGEPVYLGAIHFLVLQPPKVHILFFNFYWHVQGIGTFNSAKKQNLSGIDRYRYRQISGILIVQKCSLQTSFIEITNPNFLTSVQMATRWNCSE